MNRLPGMMKLTSVSEGFNRPGSYFFAGIVPTLAVLGRDGPFHPEVTRARKTKMMRPHHFTYFNMPAHASKLPSPSY